MLAIPDGHIRTRPGRSSASVAANLHGLEIDSAQGECCSQVGEMAFVAIEREAFGLESAEIRRTQFLLQVDEMNAGVLNGDLGKNRPRVLVGREYALRSDSF